MTPPTCKTCNRTTRLVFVACRPKSSEYYCEACHKSEAIEDPEIIDYWTNQRV